MTSSSPNESNYQPASAYCESSSRVDAFPSELQKPPPQNSGSTNTSSIMGFSLGHDCKQQAVVASNVGLRSTAQPSKEDDNMKSINGLNPELGITEGSQTYVDTWERMYTKLLEFRAKYGHCRVPNRYREDPRLGAWVAVQRRHYKLLKSGRRKKASLTPERQQRLIKIGFQWSCDVPWKAHFIQLLEFVAINGHAQVPMKWENDTKFSTWVSSQRREYKNLSNGAASALTPDQVQLLNSVGFVWQAERGGKKRFRKGHHVPILDKALANVASPVYRETAIKMLKAFGKDNPSTTGIAPDALQLQLRNPNLDTANPAVILPKRANALLETDCTPTAAANYPTSATIVHQQQAPDPSSINQLDTMGLFRLASSLKPAQTSDGLVASSIQSDVAGPSDNLLQQTIHNVQNNMVQQQLSSIQAQLNFLQQSVQAATATDLSGVVSTHQKNHGVDLLSQLCAGSAGSSSLPQVQSAAAVFNPGSNVSNPGKQQLHHLSSLLSPNDKRDIEFLVSQSSNESPLKGLARLFAAQQSLQR